MELLTVIRRWHIREGKSIREIARNTGLSRNTIRKYLADNIVEPQYPQRKSPSKLDNYEQTLTSWLMENAKLSRKKRRTTKQMHHDLVQLGYIGSYDRVAAFCRQWRQGVRNSSGSAGKNVFVPLVFAPGEAFQFDWSEDWVVIAGVNIKLQIAHFKLSHSRAFVLRAYLSQTHEMLFDAHTHAFSILGGIPQRGIYDNMKTAVDKVGRGKDRKVNTRFQAMVSHYLFEASFCSPAAGWEKGQIEKGVQDARYFIWQSAPDFKSLEGLNQWLQQRCKILWQERQHPEYKQRTIAECWNDELPHLMSMPPAFDGFVEHAKRVSSTCLINFDRNRYSVPATFANQPISLRVYADRLVVVADSQVIVKHQRVFTRDHGAPGKTIYDWRHYLAVLQRKPGALRNGAPFAEIPESFKCLQSTLLKRQGGDREMVDILALVLLHDEKLVEQAVTLALAAGHPSKEHVLNCLHRLGDTPRPVLLTPPAALKLTTEPVADTARYDQLREPKHEH